MLHLPIAENTQWFMRLRVNVRQIRPGREQSGLLQGTAQFTGWDPATITEERPGTIRMSE